MKQEEKRQGADDNEMYTRLQRLYNARFDIAAVCQQAAPSNVWPKCTIFAFKDLHESLRVHARLHCG